MLRLAPGMGAVVRVAVDRIADGIVIPSSELSIHAERKQQPAPLAKSAEEGITIPFGNAIHRPANDRTHPGQGAHRCSPKLFRRENSWERAIRR